MQIDKHFKNGFLLLNGPILFRSRPLQLSKQKKDKEIKMERHELQRKRKSFQEIKGKWMKKDQEHKEISKKRKEDSLRLILRQEGLKRDLFRQAIRKDHIKARSNPKISIYKAAVIKRYLKCLPFTAGKKFETIKLQKSQARQKNMKFLLELAVDRFFRRSTIQKAIISNLSMIVFCKKIKFWGQWIMFCIKQKKFNHLENIDSSPEQKQFQLIIYAIAGTYFHLRKFYSKEELISWVDITAYINYVFEDHDCRSVAGNFARLKALRALSDSSVKLSSINQELLQKSIMSVIDQLRISEDAQANYQNSHLNDDRQNEEISPTASQRDTKASIQDSTSQINYEDISESQIQMPLIAFRRSYFMDKMLYPYSLGKGQSYVCKFNRQFISGLSSYLFPYENPLLNVVVLNEKKQLFLFQEYIQNTSKKHILDMALARFRLKTKIQAEIRRKYLYYKKEIINVFEETIMAEEKKISLPCLFVLQKYETRLAHEIYICCDSLASHPQIKNGLQIKALLRRDVKEKDINMSQMRIRQSGRRMKRSNPRRHKEGVSIQHKRLSFASAKRPVANWVAFSPEIIEQFQAFMSQHVISIRKQLFIPKQAINRNLGDIEANKYLSFSKMANTVAL